ncbi:MAG: protein translocase subunit SecF [Acidobacteriota bacterium]
MEFFRDSRINFMKYRKVMVVISCIFLTLGVLGVFVQKKLNIGIDFAGGTQLTLQFREEPEIDTVRALLADAGIDDAVIQRFGEVEANELILKAPTVAGSEEGSRAAIIAALDQRYNEGRSVESDLNREGVEDLTATLMQADPLALISAEGAEEARARYTVIADSVIEERRERGILTSWDDLAGVGLDPAVLDVLKRDIYLGSFSVLGVENVGPQIGKELRQKGILAVVLSMLGMLAYIWVRFELRFGIGALVAVFHDVLVCLGIYAFAGFEFNLTTIAAFLTLVGYSVNDTVVIFDRVRENMRKSRRRPLIDVMNESINQTLSRTILTSGTTLLAVGSLLVLGGDVLRGFAFVVTIGIVVGTYSSIYVASPFALLWEQFFGSEAKAARAARSSA